MSDATPSGDWSRSAAAQRQYNLIGGAILAVAGLVLLATSFMLQNPVPLTVRGAVVIFTALATVAIFLVVLSLNLLGDGLRDALDPRQR